MGENGRTRSSGSGRRYPLLEALARKCEPHAIKYGISEDRTPAVLWMLVEPAVYGALGLDIADGLHARLALEAPFERYRMLPGSGYRAMWSPELGNVECEVAPCEAHGHWDDVSLRGKDKVARLILDELGLRVFPEEEFSEWESPDPHSFADTKAYNKFMHAQYVRHREARTRDLDERELNPATRVSLDAGGGVLVSVGPCSDEWVIWHDYVGGTEDESDRAVTRRYLTLRVEGATVPDEAAAAAILERLGNAALFELDRVTGVGLTPCRLGSHPLRAKREPATAPPLPSRLPSEYDREPLSLYWYARSAEDEMPLLSFLAFYQVLEFYFPAYSPIALVEALREKLRDLAAREVGEEDVEGVLEAAGLTRKRLLPEERKQLMNVLGRCVDPARLEGFLVGDEERARFYGSEASLEISRCGLPPVKGNGKRKDRRNKVAERIYDIRNRVVHAKAEHDELGPLLPFDPDAQLLRHDVELVAFLARETLSASAKPLQR